MAEDSGYKAVMTMGKHLLELQEAKLRLEAENKKLKAKLDNLAEIAAARIQPLEDKEAGKHACSGLSEAEIKAELLKEVGGE